MEELNETKEGKPVLYSIASKLKRIQNENAGFCFACFQIVKQLKFNYKNLFSSQYLIFYNHRTNTIK
jgi:hypothetical protein